MPLPIAVVAWLAFSAASSVAFAQSAPAKLDEPKVNGKAVDHCADMDGENDCSPRGEAKAALHVCLESGYKDQAGSHWRAASGTAEHFVTEYDMHAGEVGGRWMVKPTDGTFDWIACNK